MRISDWSSDVCSSDLLFCGAGGTSEGLTKAIGEGPAFAVNHNPDAIGVHAVNHPSTIHLESDVFAADPESYLSEKNIGLLVLSPSCTHFSAAKGGAPRDMAIRDQAWIAVHWAQHRNPRRSEEHTSELQSLMRISYAV